MIDITSTVESLIQHAYIPQQINGPTHCDEDLQTIKLLKPSLRYNWKLNRRYFITLENLYHGALCYSVDRWVQVENRTPEVIEFWLTDTDDGPQFIFIHMYTFRYTIIAYLGRKTRVITENFDWTNTYYTTINEPIYTSIYSLIKTIYVIGEQFVANQQLPVIDESDR